MHQGDVQRYKKIFEYADQWSVLKGKLDGKPIITRFKEALVDAIGHPDYPFQIGVAVPLLAPTLNGLPLPNEGECLLTVEDALVDALEKNQAAVHVMTITFNNMREFVFYAHGGKPESYEQEVKRVEEKISTKHQLQFMIQLDKDWEVFKKYAGQEK
ncbi:DUF695 domain-containing protein [Patescibacteria group bacterium]|jgi:hypothetical protein|nr:DUF695 domain-containing protein [Patescibacteria group bacterium]